MAKGVNSGKLQKAFKGNGVKSRAELYNLYASRVGCRYLGNENVGPKVLTSWKCSKGHVFQATPSNIQQGYNCSYCNSNDIKYVLFRNNCKTVDEYGHKLAGENPNGIKYIGGYVNNSTKAEWECSKGHRWEATPNKIQQGRGCPSCNSYKIEYVLFRNNCKTVDEYGHKIAKENPNGIKYVGGYVNDITKAEWECSKGHKWKVRPNSIKKGGGCPKCALQFSKKENALFKEVQKFYPNATDRNRGLLKNTRYELDIYIPSLKKAVEFDGDFWHSLPDAIRRDTEKDVMCTEAGIQLYRVKENNWDTDKNLVIENVLEFLKP